MFPDAKPTIGPPIDHGFYYDFHMDPIGDTELRAIEKKMNQHIRSNHTIIREEMDNDSLREMFADNKFKIEIMDDKIGHDVGSSAYRQGDFIDLCRGPHVPATSHLRWFKLTSTSTASGHLLTHSDEARSVITEGERPLVSKLVSETIHLY